MEKEPIATKKGRRSKLNVIHRTPGAMVSDNDLASPLNAVELFLDDFFVSTVQKYTNAEIQRRLAADAKQSTLKEFGTIEIRASLGLLVLSGVTKSK